MLVHSYCTILKELVAYGLNALNYPPESSKRAEEHLNWSRKHFVPNLRLMAEAENKVKTDRTINNGVKTASKGNSNAHFIFTVNIPSHFLM